MTRTLVTAFALTSFAAGCAEAPGPDPGPQVAIDVAALNLEGVGDVIWDLEVRTAADVVWQRRVTSSTHGDSAGSASYVGPCDADAGTNTVRVWVVGVYAGDITAANAGAFASGSAASVTGTALPFQNPTATAPLTRDIACSANADAAVQFDVTLMRPATQGFFDVAVSFNNIFCSAKFDCCAPGLDGVCASDGSEDLALLFDASGARARTFVLGFACTAGLDGATTELVMDPIALDCTAPTTPFVADLQIDVDPDAPGNQCTAGADGMSACSPRVLQLGSVDPDAVLYQVAVYRGAEALTSGGVLAEKRYWNVALGVKGGAGGIANCRLSTRATAEDAATTDDLVVDGTVAAGTVYPYVTWDVDLASCAAEPLRFGDPAAPVRTDYTGTTEGATTFTYTWAPGLVASYTCAPACAHGACTGNGLCSCDAGWIGADCATPVCTTACASNRECTAPDTCTCTADWTGAACDVPVCDSACAGNRSCTAPDTCTCSAGWSGAGCDVPVCDPACTGNRSCTAPDTCTCSTGWTGAACDVPVCTPACGVDYTCTAPNTCTFTAPQPCTGVGCNIFSHTGANQSFVVPAGVTSLTVKLWGGGGGGGGETFNSSPSVGGGGGFATGTFAVTPGETLTIVVGGRGQYTASNAAYGGGGGSGQYGGNYVSGGGGRSAIRRGATELLTAGGGGGGGGEYGSNNGGAGGGTAGTAATGACAGGGGSQNLGGTAGACNYSAGIPGSALQGGGNNYCGGGGGGGWWGGGSGNHQSPGTYCGAGGGGSGHLGAGVTGSLTAGSGATPAATADVDYASGVGVGGAYQGHGGHGRVVIDY